MPEPPPNPLLPLVRLGVEDGHKRLSYIGWFTEFAIGDTERVLSSTLELDFPPASDEGLPFEGYYEISVFISCQEWDASVPPVRLATFLSQTLEVKGEGESYTTVDRSHHYTQGVGTSVNIFNNSLQGTAIIYVDEGETCSDRKAWIKFTGPQTSTASVQISDGYVTLQYLGKSPGNLCEDS
jgi:hypothetical protein